MTLLPPLEGVPSDDPVADTQLYIDALEAHVRTCPEQYFWIHRKFKDLPDKYPEYYSDLAALK
jgi:KDO2-lipid IV(A) lauroyltransferase